MSLQTIDTSGPRSAFVSVTATYTTLGQKLSKLLLRTANTRSTASLDATNWFNV
jgi:hypothetical protein